MRFFCDKKWPPSPAHFFLKLHTLKTTHKMRPSPRVHQSIIIRREMRTKSDANGNFSISRILILKIGNLTCSPLLKLEGASHLIFHKKYVIILKKIFLKTAHSISGGRCHCPHTPTTFAHSSVRCAPEEMFKPGVDFAGEAANLTI